MFITLTPSFICRTIQNPHIFSETKFRNSSQLNTPSSFAPLSVIQASIADELDEMPKSVIIDRISEALMVPDRSASKAANILRHLEGQKLTRNVIFKTKYFNEPSLRIFIGFSFHTIHLDVYFIKKISFGRGEKIVKWTCHRFCTFMQREITTTHTLRK